MALLPRAMAAVAVAISANAGLFCASYRWHYEGWPGAATFFLVDLVLCCVMVASGEYAFRMLRLARHNRLTSISRQPPDRQSLL
jgi:hypothetical protein